MPRRGEQQKEAETVGKRAKNAGAATKGGKRVRGEYGRGSVTYDEPHGRYQVTVPLGHGKRRRAWAKTEDAAERMRDRFIRERDEEAAERALIGTEQQTLEQFLSRWLEHSVSQRVRGHTLDCYDARMRKVCGEIGHITLGELKPAHIREMFSTFRKRGLSGATLLTYHIVLRSALAEAVADEMIPRNPTDSVKRPKVVRAERPVLSWEDAQRVLRAARGTRWYPLWLLLIQTGVRIGEALALTWEHVDMTDSRIDIRFTVTQVKGKGLIAGPPKTPRSNRSVWVPPQVIATLQEVKRQQIKDAKERLAQGERRRTDLVFPAERSGSYIRSQVVWDAWNAALDAAGVKHIRIHDIRHTTSTVGQRAGTDRRTTSTKLGHEDERITGTYSHTSEQALRDDADVWERLLDDSRDEERQA